MNPGLSESSLLFTGLFNFLLPTVKGEGELWDWVGGVTSLWGPVFQVPVRVPGAATVPAPRDTPA